MEFRPANADELDAVFMMGYDTWSEGLAPEKYLLDCRDSAKYNSAAWYVLADGSTPVASLLIHSFAPWGARIVKGIGSVATQPELRGKGYGHSIVSSAVAELTQNQNTGIVFLYSDIRPDFYVRHGFVALPAEYQSAPKSTAMVLMLPHFDRSIIDEYRDRVPKYF